jgi:hypothetical protein
MSLQIVVVAATLAFLDAPRDVQVGYRMLRARVVRVALKMH